MSRDVAPAKADELEQLLAFRVSHLAWPVPPNIIETVGEADARVYLEARAKRILQSEADPLRFGYEPDIWIKADAVRENLRKVCPKGVIVEMNLGGNRAGKSARAAKRVVQACLKEPEQSWWCCDSTEAMSRANQQRFIYQFLPQEYKNLKGRDAVTKIKYSLADGFTENMLVFPNRSQITFKFYSMDVATLPGPELSGVYCDELVPLSWIDVLTYRLTNRDGILHITFTPEEHWTETVAYFVEGATTVEEAPAELCPKRDEDGGVIGYKSVPRVQQCAQRNARIVYFHTADNPFGNYAGMKETLRGKSEVEVLMRAYGVVTKSSHCAFPMFNRSVHVRSEEWWEDFRDENKSMQRVMFVDPCSGRNWFLIWVAMPCPRKWIVYREWPSYGHLGAYIPGFGDLGPWTTASHAADGARGRAQDSLGFGLNQYKEEIERLEDSEDILARWIDSRYAQAAAQSREGVTTLIEQLAEIGIEFLAATAESRILNVKEGSIDLINTALFYDTETDQGKFSPKLGRLNEPELLVLETCPNTIYSLSHWSGQDGQKGACKDPVDCLRMLFLSGVEYQSTETYAWLGGGIPR